MEETTLFFFPESTCNYCHTPVTPCHPRQETAARGRERKARDDVLGGCHWEQRESSFEEKGRRIKRREKTRELVNHELSVSG